MSKQLWDAVDSYFTNLLLPPDPVLEATLKQSDAADLPPINVAPNQGKLLHILALMRGARRILEIGTLGGYSTIWLSRALPKDGQLISLEFSPKHADVARANVARAGLDSLVEIRVGDAARSLARLVEEAAPPFDLIFIDADKRSYPVYLEMAMELATEGTVIVADNIVRNGAVMDSDTEDPNVQGVRRYLDLIANEPRLTSTAIQTVGTKGYDGLSISIVTS